MPSRRSDPEQWLGHAVEAETRANRGKLRIFFGMAPGVGKTYAMLSEAHRLAARGVDVVIGIVETHGRAETEQLLLGLDILPRRTIEYRGTKLYELDLDAALARRPEVLLIDELAHTNAPGSRFDKRWRDIAACLDAGIDVWTTLNVQHLESLNDVVAQITGVAVRETVPDSVIDEAHEIEVVDLPPDALLERLRAGKVYLPDQIATARDAFFRTGNLTALRELVLRRAAAWVDRRVQVERHAAGVRGIWPTTDRIMVCVGPSPTSRRLLRAAHRLAAGMRAELLAVHLDAGERGSAKESVLETMRLAQSLGADPISIPLPAGSNAVDELLHLARERNVSKIVIGRTGRSRLMTALVGSFADDLIRRSGDVSIYILGADETEAAGDVDEARADPAEARPPLWTKRRTPRRGLLSCLLIAAAIAGITTVAGAALFSPPDLSDEAMLFLGSVVVAAWRFGRRTAVLAAILGVASFNFFFTEPRFTFMIDDPRLIVTCTIMLVTGLCVSELAARLRTQADEAREGERRSSALYGLTRSLTRARDEGEVANAACRQVAEVFAADAVITGPPRGSETDRMPVLGSAGAPDWFDDRERAVARWAFDHGRVAGLGTRALPGSAGRFIPLDVPHGRIGCLAIRPRRPDDLLDAQSLLLLDAFAAQISLALERVDLIEAGGQARLAAEAERLRSALLSSVSHDLRTPLASLAGGAAALRDSDASLDAETRRALLDSIVDESSRLNELVSNLVFATRLEQGVDLRREWTTVEEIVGAGLEPLRTQLASRRFRVAVPRDLPMILVDNALMPQVVHNLVENAIRHTSVETPIELLAWRDENHVIVRVTDEGSGLSEGDRERVFDRFVRGRGGATDHRAGLGLGLTIARGIVTAHGGRIWAEPNEPRGAAFFFSIPIDQPQPAPAPEAAP